MKNKKYIITGLILLAVLGVIFYSLFGRKGMTEEKARLEMASKMKDTLMRILTTPINFYGKVVDQDGKPLAGVKVPASMETFTDKPLLFFSGLKTYETETDSEGRFEFKGAGKSLIIGILKKDGYEYDRASVKQDHFYYAKEMNENLEIYKPDIKNPPVFELRKKEKAEFLLVKTQVDGDVKTINPKEGIYCYSMYYGYIQPKTEYLRYYKEKPYLFTFEIKVSPMENNTQSMTIVMKAMDKIFFQVAPKEIYVAPESGYNLQEKMFTFRRTIAYNDVPYGDYGPNNVRKTEKVLINKLVEYQKENGAYVNVQDFSNGDNFEVPFIFLVKDENYNVYSKVYLKIEAFNNRKEGTARFEIGSVTNPHGNRILEINEGLQTSDENVIKKYASKLGVKTDQDLSDEWRAKCERESKEQEEKEAREAAEFLKKTPEEQKKIQEEKDKAHKAWLKADAEKRKAWEADIKARNVKPKLPPQ